MWVSSNTSSLKSSLPPGLPLTTSPSLYPVEAFFFYDVGGGPTDRQAVLLIRSHQDQGPCVPCYGFTTVLDPLPYLFGIDNPHYRQRLEQRDNVEAHRNCETAQERS